MATIGQLPSGTSRHDWRILLNGRDDEMSYESGHLAGGLPYPELKESAHINAAASQADQAADFFPPHPPRAARLRAHNYEQTT